MTSRTVIRSRVEHLQVVYRVLTTNMAVKTVHLDPVIQHRVPPRASIHWSGHMLDVEKAVITHTSRLCSDQHRQASKCVSA